MPGTNAGTGSPIHFRCSKCRKSGYRRSGVFDVTLTGRWKECEFASSRTTKRSVEYTCSCGHTGWSRHIDLAMRAVREKIMPTFEHYGRML